MNEEWVSSTKPAPNGFWYLTKSSATFCQFTTKEERDRVASIFDATRGYSPECVAAALKAVEAEENFRNIETGLGRETAYRHRNGRMQAAIRLLPKKGE